MVNRAQRTWVIAVAALLATACVEERPDAPPSRAGEAVGTASAARGGSSADTADIPSCDDLANELLRTPITRAALSAEYGAPDSLLATTEPNRHVEGATDSLFTVFYPGLTALLRTPTDARDMVTHVTVSDNRYVAYPRIGIDADAASVTDALGAPHTRDAGSLVYACGEAVEQPVTFHLANGVVRSIDISYYVD